VGIAHAELVGRRLRGRCRAWEPGRGAIGARPFHHMVLDGWLGLDHLVNAGALNRALAKFKEQKDGQRDAKTDNMDYRVSLRYKEMPELTLLCWRLCFSQAP
jgi:hypothetical protein